MTKLRRLTRMEKLRAWRRKWLVRIAWLWRRLPGCKCDPDAYGLHDIPEPICGEYRLSSIEQKVAAGWPRALAALVGDVDSCCRCGHDPACHSLAALRAAGGEEEK